MQDSWKTMANMPTDTDGVAQCEQLLLCDKTPEGQGLSDVSF